MKKCTWKSVFFDYKCERDAFGDSNYCLFHKPEKSNEEGELFWAVINFNPFSERLIRLTNNLYSTKMSGTGRIQILREMSIELDQIITAANKVHKPLFDKYNFNIDTLYYSSKIAGNTQSLPDFRGFVFPKNEYRFEYIYNPYSSYPHSLNFSEVKFEGPSNFSGFNFIGETIFEHNSFNNWVLFTNATFQKKCSFINTLDTGHSLREAGMFENTKFLGSEVIFSNIKGTSVVINNASFSANTKLVLKEMNYPKDFGRASYGENAYRVAKNQAMIVGNYLTAGDYYYNERVYKRKQMIPNMSFIFIDSTKKGIHRFRLWGGFKNNAKVFKIFRKNIIPYVFDYVMYRLTGYGEKPYKIISSSIIVIVLFAIGNMTLGKEPSFLDSLFYSLISFTTLGAGIPSDIELTPYFKFMLSIESLIGALFIALFIVTISKRFSRG